MPDGPIWTQAADALDRRGLVAAGPNACMADLGSPCLWGDENRRPRLN